MTARRRPNAVTRAIPRQPALLEALVRDLPEAAVLDREALCRAYLDEGLDICAIARKAGCRPSIVVLLLRAHGIPMRPPSLRGVPPLADLRPADLREPALRARPRRR